MPQKKGVPKKINLSVSWNADNFQSFLLLEIFKIQLLGFLDRGLTMIHEMTNTHTHTHTVQNSDKKQTNS